MKTKKLLKIVFVVTWLILVSGLVSAIVIVKNDTKSFQVETVSVEKGAISNTVTATGTLEATNTIIIGTQVSGVIEKIHASYNSVVKKGQLLAEIDKSTLQFALKTSEAELASAQAEFDYHESNYKRMTKIYEKRILTESDYDLVKYNYRKSIAALQSATANLEMAKRNLNYTMIYSPIDGIVLDQTYDEGQTVTASMSTPELFTIANDLSKMHVEVDVDEADIGMVEEGQRVEFTVDSFPLMTFSGKITQVRLKPIETSNVVTYTVIVSANNPDLKLKPGMTASITAYVEEANDVLIVAEKAFRFTPEQKLMDAYLSYISQNREAKPKTEDPPRINKGRPEKNRTGELTDNMQSVWVVRDGLIEPVIVKTGINDGINYQVISGLVAEDTIITSLTLEAKLPDSQHKSKTQSSPFVEKRPPERK